jgi:D-alanyl-lipoteichoic acid acyltransferase DltB (MBOAT superfamily)
MRNFDRPYASRSIKEFWRRWHMTLMSWLKDYVYIPLGGSRVSKGRRYLNILAVFAFSGLWHGAGLTFLVWGLLNGAYQIIGEWLAPLRDRVAGLLGIRPDGRLRHVLATATTFVLATVAWVFFRAGSLSDAVYIVGHMFVPTAAFLRDLRAFDIGLSIPEVVRTAIAVPVVFGIDWLSSRTDLPGWLYRRPLVLRWAIYELGLLTVVIFGQYGPAFKAADFVYFKF